MSVDTNGEQLHANEEFQEGLRLGIAARMGNLSTFGDENDLRDTWDTFGWPKDPDEEDWLALYLRNAFARVVVDKPAFTTWRDEPEIVDVADRNGETDFETEVQTLVREHDFWNYGQRVDRVAGVGQHGLLAISFADVIEDEDAWATDARQAELSGLDDVRMFKPLLQTQIDDIEWGDPGSERWGRPKFYDIDWGDDVDEDDADEKNSSFRVHWSRVIDVPSTRLLDDDTLARPRAEPVLNNLIDIEKTLGSAAEQSYRGADYGLHLNWDPEKVDTSQIDNSEMKDEFQRWYHGLQPELKTQGAELTALGGEMQDPTGLVENNLKAIYAQTGIPKREFIGNQQGEQSGAEQDEKSYFGTIAERRKQYATRHIVRPKLQRLIDVGILSEPRGGRFETEWPDLAELSELETSEIHENRAVAAKNVAPQGNTDLLPGGMDGAIEYLESGEFPAQNQGAAPMGVADPMDTVDENDPVVAEQFALANTIAANQDDLDEVFAEYQDTVNMSASELERWASTDCSSQASLSRSPIERNIRLLQKNKSEWTEGDITDAKRTISFVARMRGTLEETSNPRDGTGECPKNVVIALKNWAFDPFK